MKKFENEIKVLEIDKLQIEKKLQELGAQKIDESLQKIYVYDLHTIYSRFYDCLLQLKNCSKTYEYEVCRNKLQILLTEVDNLLTEEERSKISDEFRVKSLVYLLNITENKELLEKFSNSKIIEILKKYGFNPNKWIRLRETNGKTTITIKHIFNDITENEGTAEQFQKTLETEMEVPSIEEGNAILEQLGFSFRNYQEKKRITYKFEGSVIDIDSWPLIPTYLEIEDDSFEKIQEIIKKLGLESKECISCNTAQIYKKYGIDIYQYRQLKFPRKQEIKGTIEGKI